MHKKQISMLALLICFSITTVFAQNNEYLMKLNEQKSANFYDIKNNMDNYYNSFPDGAKKSGYKQYKRWEWFWDTRKMPDGTFPNELELLNIYNKSLNSQPKGLKLQGYDWKLIGPVITPTEMMNSTGLGRINCIEFHPDTPDDIWIGAAGGGIWHSSDKGKNWSMSYPDSKFLTLGINDIAISHSNPNVIYAATGDAFGAGAAGYSTYSVGVIKSTNKGVSWENTELRTELANQNKIAAVLVKETDENTVLVGSKNGIYKTTDGGKTWQVKQGGDEFYHLEVHPTNENIVYASTFRYGLSRVYKSTNFGDNWSIVLSNSGSNRTRIAVTPDDPDGVYAVVCASDNGFHSFWYSEDSGTNWEKMSDRASTTNILGWDNKGGDDRGQGWYDLAITIDPKNMSNIYVGGIHVWKSDDGGRKFSIATHSRGLYQLPYVHADVHDMKFTKDGSRIYLTCDGGVYYSNDKKNWVDITNGLPITQFYRFCSDLKNPNRLIAGAQDNSTIKKNGDAWDIVYGGDGADCWIDPNNSDYWYYSYVNGEFRRSINAGANSSNMINPGQFQNEEGAWIAPMTIDFAGTNRLYVGFKQIYRSENYGKTDSWIPVSSFTNNDPMIALSVYNRYIYAANHSKIFYSSDDGYHWETKNLTYVTAISIDPNNPKRAWISQGGFSPNAKVVEFKDGNFTNISGNLPNVPINCIVYQKNSPDRIFVGTDIGVYYTDYNSSYWQRYGNDLPNTIVTDIELLPDSKKIRISTYGRGLWEAPLTDCNLPQPQISAIGETSFCQGGSVVLKADTEKNDIYWSTGETTKEITVKNSGVYSYTVREGDCTATSKGIQVTVYEIPTLTIGAVEELAFCRDQNESVDLIASSGFNSYLWSTGETTRQIAVSSPGLYKVTATTKEGCTTNAEITVIERERPEKPSVLFYQGSVWSSVNASKFKWYKDGKPMPKSNARSMEIGQQEAGNGVYTVEIWDEYGCQNISDGLEVVADVNEVSSNDIKVTPNPIEEHFSIEADLNIQGNVTIQVLDISGKSLYESSNIYVNSKLVTKVDIDNFSSGVYILQIKSKDKIWVKQIVKK